MKKLFVAVMFAAVLSLSAAVEFKLVADREMPIYKCGENATFTLTATENGTAVKSGKYQLLFRLGGRTEVKKVPVDFSAGNPVKAQVTLKEPGFVLVSLMNLNGKRVGGRKAIYAGAGFEPEKIRKGYEMPADFMKFWEDGRKQLANTPIELTKCEKYSTAKHTTYYVKVKSLNDEIITGYLKVPNGKGKYPAYINVPGAGPGVSGPPVFGGSNMIGLAMNVHKFPTKDNAKDQKAAYREELKKGSYPLRGAGDRDKYFFRSVYVAIDRVINHVAALPQWDGKHMVIDGSSQGGGSALILAGFNKNITALAANVPALCDHGGFKLKRNPGWPTLCNRPNPDSFAPYFDAAIFASFIKVPALVSCGFIDTTCPPASVYAAFNELKGEKKMIHVPLEGHTISKIFQSERYKFLRKHTGLTK